MLFWIFIVLAVVSFIFARLYVFDCEGGWIALGVICAVISAVMLFIILGLHCGTNGMVASCRERYKSLMYKAETEACRDEFGIVNKDYIDEVQNWNEDLSYNKAMQRDFWVGIFVPNIYDEFELIDLNSIKYKTY